MNDGELVDQGFRPRSVSRPAGFDGRPRSRPASWWTRPRRGRVTSAGPRRQSISPPSHPTSVSTGLRSRGTVRSGLLAANVASASASAAAAQPPAAAEQESGVLAVGRGQHDPCGVRGVSAAAVPGTGCSASWRRSSLRRYARRRRVRRSRPGSHVPAHDGHDDHSRRSTNKVGIPPAAGGSV